MNDAFNTLRSSIPTQLICNHGRNNFSLSLRERAGVRGKGASPFFRAPFSEELKPLTFPRIPCYSTLFAGEYP